MNRKFKEIYHVHLSSRGMLSENDFKISFDFLFDLSFTLIDGILGAD